WVMDRGIPTEDVLAEMRQSDPPVAYLVGTPKGRLSKLEKSLVGLPWCEVRPGVEVKLLAEDDDLYVFAQSRARIDKERAMRKRQLKQLWAGDDPRADPVRPRAAQASDRAERRRSGEISRGCCEPEGPRGADDGLCRGTAGLRSRRPEGQGHR